MMPNCHLDCNMREEVVARKAATVRRNKGYCTRMANKEDNDPMLLHHHQKAVAISSLPVYLTVASSALSSRTQFAKCAAGP